MKKIEKNKEQKRAAILAAAQDVFRTDGYVGAGMDLIASRAGVTKQTVYRYFPSKEELFQAALQAQRWETGNRFLDELDREDAAEALGSFAVEFLKVHMSEEHLAGMRLLFAEGPEAPAVARAHLAQGPHKVETRLAEFFGQRLGVADPQFTAKAFLGTLLAPRTHVLLRLCDPLPEDAIAAHAQSATALFLTLSA